ncbi:MAG TPA: EAL domain-containing protein [Burkholderiaceae bacterium]
MTAVKPIRPYQPGRPLGKRIAMATVVTAACALILASAMLMVFQFLSQRSALVADLTVQARIIGNNSSAAILFRDRAAGEEILAGLSASPGLQAAALFDRYDGTLARYERAGAAPAALPSLELLSQGYQYGVGHVDVAQPIHADGRQVGHVVLRASLEQLYTRLFVFAALTLAVAAGSLAIAYLLVSRMRVEVREAEAHLQFLALVDPVTGLPNRHAFNQRLTDALAHADHGRSGVGLLLLDLDNFKIVNDTLGHDNGDILLEQVAQRLQESLRETDVVCRIGGDEFVIIIEQGMAPVAVDADRVARKILVLLAAPFDIDGNQIYVSASVGVSLYPRDAGDAQTLMRSADTAMYHAKSNGKDTFEIFQPEMHLRAEKRMRMEANLRRALEHNELQLHYQPQIELASGRVVSVEALARWTCNGQPISPAEFIPVAEESGLIVPLGRWVLRTACEQAAQWREAGMDVRMAVNLSARQTKDAGLMHEILSVLDETGLPANQLELEITEGILMENVNANLELMRSLQQAGIHLAIDDFGTGYSSMSYLKRFPVGQLKIDRSFVMGIPGEGAAIATAIIAMAHSLHLTVVAEGVETADQLAFLREAGCDYVQGYYFARPMPQEGVTAMLREQAGNTEPAATA